MKMLFAQGTAMLDKFRARARKAVGKSPVAADYIRTSRVPVTLQYKSWATQQPETHKTDLPYIAMRNGAGTWDVKINILVYDSAMNENMIDQTLLEGVPVEQAVDYLLEKEKEYAAQKNAIQPDGSDFAAYCDRRGASEDARHVTNAALRLRAAGVELAALAPPKAQKSVTAGTLARIRKTHAPS